MYEDCTIAGNADAIVSEDAHFDALKIYRFPPLKFSLLLSLLLCLALK